MTSKLFEVGAPDVVYVVDLSSYLLRAYHAVAPLSSPKGEPTHAVHGTVTMLERLFRERKPQQLAIAMDSGRATFRKEIYEDYKANRPPAPDDLRVQMKRSEEVVRAWGLAVFKQDGVEADDLIASIVEACRSENKRVVIVSADKDLMQLVSDQILMWDTLRNKVFGPTEVQERFSVPPEQLGDLLALMGDSSDNIPGVPSVGPKTAATLLQEHHTLDGIFAHLESIKRKKLKETLGENEALARLSRRLVELKRDCPVDVSDEHLSFSHPERRDETALETIFQDLGFTRQLAALRAQKSTATEGRGTEAPAGASAQEETAKSDPSPQEVPPSIQVITETAELDQLCFALSKGSWAFESFTVRPDHHRGPILGAALCGDDTFFYIPFGHRYVGAPPQLDALDSLKRVTTALDGNESRVIVHQLKRQLVLLHQAGINTTLPRAFDVLLASYLADPERNHQLEALGSAVDVQVDDYDAATKEGRKKRTWDELEVQKAAELALQRTRATLRAKAQLQQTLEGLNMLKLLDEVELPLARELAELEERGVLVDKAVLSELGQECSSLLGDLETEAKEAAGKEFNVNSPRQLEEILFDEIGLKPIKRTKTSRSTDAQTLEALADEHPLPSIILKIRQLAKLQGTYIEALPQLMDKSTGRIHGSWEQAVAATGRLSSVDPNLQNIPIRSEMGRRIRDAFVAPEGYQIVSADYSQIELRVLAHLSQDDRLVEAFQTGQDVHLRTAMEIFELEEGKVTKEHRARAKAVNFGVIYGQGESALAKSLGIERADASRFIAAYFRRYDGVRTFMDATLEQARAGQAVQSLLGRRRVVPDIKSGNRARRLAAERIAMNMPIQGSAADILKLAMLKLATPPTAGARMVLTVHDELVFEVPNAEVDEAKEQIKNLMESAYELSVPLIVDVGSGSNWNAAH